MTSRDFCYWLQGYFELQAAWQTNDAGQTLAVTPNIRQIHLIQKHLALVFQHEIDPSFGGKLEQDTLNHLHNPIPVRPDALIRC